MRSWNRTKFALERAVYRFARLALFTCSQWATSTDFRLLNLKGRRTLEVPDPVVTMPDAWRYIVVFTSKLPPTLLTISASPSLYSQMVTTIAISVLRAGFRRLFFLNGHGGNQVPGAQALSELVAENDAANDAPANAATAQFRGYAAQFTFGSG